MMTRRNPSRISRSLRLSRSFLSCTIGNGRVAALFRRPRTTLADCAASMVRSRAGRRDISRVD